MSQQKLEELLKPHIKASIGLELIRDKSAKVPSIKTKFGGFPYAETKDVWPKCSKCRKALTFVAQLEEKHEYLLHTFYYCFKCRPWGLDDEESGQWLVRTYRDPSMKKLKEIKDPRFFGKKVTPCRTIEHELKVLPSWDTLEWTIPEADVLCDKLNPDAPWEPHNVAVEHLECFDGLASLVGGYPSMEDYEVTKKCKFCGGKMHFFAQIFPDYHARITWLLGDVGIINLYHCNKHKDEFFLHLNLQDLTRSANPKYRLLSNS